MDQWLLAALQEHGENLFKAFVSELKETHDGAAKLLKVCHRILISLIMASNLHKGAHGPADCVEGTASFYEASEYRARLRLAARHCSYSRQQGPFGAQHMLEDADEVA